MDSILSELGVVNEVEENLRLQVQTFVEEQEKQVAAAAVASAAATANGPASGSGNRPSAVAAVGSKDSKKSTIMTILEGANSAPDVSSGKVVHTQHKAFKRDEKVKFITDLEDIPNTNDREMKFHGGKRGYYDASTSLNLFASSAHGGVHEYHSSTHVDQNTLKELVREAKKRKVKSSTSSGSQTTSVVSSCGAMDNRKNTDTPEDGEIDESDEFVDQEAIPSSLLHSTMHDQGDIASHASSIAHGANTHAANNGRSTSSVDVSDIVCPICNRSIGTSDNAALIDRHIERCARRGSRNIRNYDEDFTEQTQGTRSSAVSALRITTRPARALKASSSRQAVHNTDSGADSGDAEDNSASESDWESVGPSGSNSARGHRNKPSYMSPSGSASSLDRAVDSSHSGISDKRSSARATRSKSSSAATASASKSRTAKKKASSSSHQHHTAVYGEETVPSFEEEEDDSSHSDDDAVGFVASIVDDWEDTAYDARIASQVAAAKQKRKQAAKDRKKNISNAENAVAVNAAEEKSGSMRTEYGTEVLHATWESLHQYQRDGCRWLHGLYDEGVGGILGDEMGLGKTAQVCTHFGSLALLHNENARDAGVAAHRAASSIFIVVCPATVLHHWLQEFHRWAPFMRTVVLHSISTTASELLKIGDNAIPRVLRKLQKKPNTQGLTVVTTYEGLRKHRQALVSIEWTAVCLDEGQKIRNPSTEITSTCKMLPAFHRLILSGTPIQNSLRELWSLFDFIYPGRLGSLVVFEQEFANPIRMGGYANANALQYEIAIRCASTLQKVVKPYLLRRKKDDLIAVTRLPAKTEQVLFCQISPRQREVYLNIISSSEVKAVMERRMMAFRAINTLRKLCNHPALVFQQGKIVWQQDPTLEATHAGQEADGDLEDNDDDDADATALLSKVGSGGIVWADSGKLLVLSKLLPLWYSEGHKVLIFSQTRGMLSIIESMVRELGFLYLRLDGSTPVSKRAGLVNSFNTNPKIFVMLLTTRTGGVGISLTAANRVVLFDPDWNPMTDIQSRERAWRLGQTREVTVYRLITRGTIEEKIYQRQIFKLLLSNRILDNAKQKAMFSQTHMKELFELNDGFCKGGFDRHGYAVGGESLPVGGEVNLLAEAKGAEPAAAAAAVPQAVAATPDNTGTGHHNDGGAIQDLGQQGLLEVEDYVEPAPLSAELLQTMESAEEPGADGSTSRDRRLLQALFAGDAITSVYDHHYFDPTHKAAPASLPKAAERITVRQEATTAVNRALYELHSSATVYQGSASSSTSGAPTGNVATSSRNSSYGDFRQISINGMEVQAVGVQSGASSRPRFGTSSASFSGTSSSALLAGLSDAHISSNRSNAAYTGGADLASVAILDNPYVPHLPVQAASSSAASRTVTVGAAGTTVTVGSNSSAGASAESAQSKMSVKQDIQSRLTAIFSRADRPLSTAFVLSRFKDLGDQYAPLFRELLRTVAVHNNGMWSKK